MSQHIINEYLSAGIRPPDGKGEHTLAFHQRAIKLMKSGVSRNEAYAIAMKQLGRNASVKKSHRSTNYRLGVHMSELKKLKELQSLTKLKELQNIKIKSRKASYMISPKLVELYKKDPKTARLFCAQQGIPLEQIAFQAGVMKYNHELLPGWSIGVRDGELEATGKKAPPGAVTLAWRTWKYGKGYPLGRQRVLTKAGFSGGTKDTQTLLDFIKDLT